MVLYQIFLFQVQPTWAYQSVPYSLTGFGMDPILLPQVERHYCQGGPFESLGFLSEPTPRNGENGFRSQGVDDVYERRR